MSQVWGTEQFTEGATTYGSSPDLYASVQPWVPTPASVLGYNLGVAPGTLFDGYQAASGLASGAAAAVRLGGVGADGDAVWSVSRAVVDEAQVIAVPSLLVRNGPNNNDSFKSFGVCSHCSVGLFVTPGSGAPDEYRSDVTGYFLIEAREVLARHRVFLIELNAGVITVLVSQLVNEVDPEHVGPIDNRGFQPRRLRLVVEKNGTGADITAFRSVPGSTEAALFGGTTITRGTRLADGRCGFGVQTYRQDTTGADVIGLVDTFRVLTMANAPIFTDSFERLIRNAARTLTDGQQTGRSLCSEWTGDAESNDNVINNVSQIRRVAGADAVETGANVVTGSRPGYHVRQNPEVSASQAYVGVFTRLNQDTSIPVEMGLMCRFTVRPYITGNINMRGRTVTAGFPRTDTYKHGYSAAVVRSSGGAWSLEVRHFDGTSAGGYIAPVIGTADLTASGLALDVAFLFSMDVQSFNGDTFGIGTNVALKFKVNGVTITPVQGGQLGVAVLNDYLIDTRTAATQENGGAGFLVIPETVGSADLVRIGSISEVTREGDVGLAIEDMATVAVLAETDNVSGTLNLPIESSLSEASSTLPIVHRMESGKIQTIIAQPADRRTWSCLATLNSTEYLLLLALFESNGSHTPFNWVRPDTGEAVVALFSSPELDVSVRHVELGNTVYALSWSMEELFAATDYN